MLRRAIAGPRRRQNRCTRPYGPPRGCRDVLDVSQCVYMFGLCRTSARCSSSALVGVQLTGSVLSYFTHFPFSLFQPRLRALASRDTRRCAICDDFFGWGAARTPSVVVSASLSGEVLTALRLAIPVGSRVCARHVNVVRVPSLTPGRTRRELKLCSTDRRLHYSRGLSANRLSRAAVEPSGDCNRLPRQPWLCCRRRSQ